MRATVHWVKILWRKQILKGVDPFAIDLQAEHGFNNQGEQLSIPPILLESLLKLGRAIVNSPEFDGYSGLRNTFFKDNGKPVGDAAPDVSGARLSFAGGEPGAEALRGVSCG